MAYVQVPKDLTKVKTKFLLNLTKRQCLCFGLAAIVGVPFYIFTKDVLGQTFSATLMILIMLPFFFFAMYEKDGRPLEVIIKNMIVAKFIRPGIRPSDRVEDNSSSNEETDSISFCLRKVRVDAICCRLPILTFLA